MIFVSPGVSLEDVIDAVVRRLLRESALEHAVEFDEFCQGYDERGRVVICICGAGLPTERLRREHNCAYIDYLDQS